MANDTTIDPRALDSLSVAPSEDADAKNAGGQGPVNEHDDALDEALDETMDGSDPVSSTQPSQQDPAPSSGFDEKAEADRRDH
ncbi:hypothetical protein ASE75_13450 [Sphingomonas sp. Leaf17]|uniref:hypothetical protein n=1 Tax=Sphingomonas sp. Leaf17 TaxID=1735683 RepID=UPI0006FC9896|nr:hypothetical protein [Sphingomonas sp. Leaf17]KQM63440.1 hypothetical protein ASE75_13450 [Sphingomonas sp. Leaf17]